MKLIKRILKILLGVFLMLFIQTTTMLKEVFPNKCASINIQVVCLIPVQPTLPNNSNIVRQKNNTILKVSEMYDIRGSCNLFKLHPPLLYNSKYFNTS